MGYKITIDGPSGCGKGYVAREISKRLGYMHIDTGAMYRAFALYCKNNNVNLDNETEIMMALKKIEIDFVKENETLKIFLNGVDVSADIRSEQVGMLAAVVATILSVRQDMVERQRKFAGQVNLVMDGRDIGSVVFPDAELKIFLTADANIRAKRRYDELIEKGKDITFEEVLKDLKLRDQNDITRTISPLVKTDDMVEVDTTNLNKKQVVDEVLNLVKQKGLV